MQEIESNSAFYQIPDHTMTVILSHNDFFSTKQVGILFCLENTHSIMGDKEMKMKRKILAIFVILLMIAIPISIAQADETTQTSQSEETIVVELAAYQEDGTITTETLILTEEELEEFQSTVSQIMDNIQNENDWGSIKDLIEKFFGGKRPVLNLITGIFFKFKTFLNRALVISSGHSYKLNPLKKSQIKIRKRICFWHYSKDEPIRDRTLILKPLKLKFKSFTGAQVGFMRKFTGLYIYIARSLPQKSYTFFFGTARNINGIQLPSISR